jgi:long-chain acyl-CoA synthetase
MTHSALTQLRYEVAPAAPSGPPSVAQVLDHWVSETPETIALIDQNCQLTYRELDEAVNRAAGLLLDFRVGASDRVAGSLPNTAAVVIAFLATMRIGGIWVGINRNLTLEERGYILSDTEASIYLCETLEQSASNSSDAIRRVGLEEWTQAIAAQQPVRRDIACDPFAPAAISYTSGTTGVPKGAVHSQHNIIVSAVANSAGVLKTGSRPGVVLPLTILNLMTLGPVAGYSQGATVIVVDRRDPVGIAERVRLDQIESFSAPPAIVHDLLSNPAVDPRDLESLSGLGVGASTIPPGLEERYRTRFGRGFSSGYGLTEAPAVVTRARWSEEQIPGSNGKALPHVHVTIRDSHDRELGTGEDGEVCVGTVSNGPWAAVYTPMLGYWNQPDASHDALRGGRLHTGDIGYLDSDGNLFITGRKNDLIIRGGANVYPAEVELVLAGHPGVDDCAVVGKSDDRLGEVVVAFIQPAPGAVLCPEELLEYCKSRLARYKVPIEFHTVVSFPRNAMGKVAKHELRERLK